MSKAQLSTDLPKLKLAEIDGREWLDDDDTLTDAEKLLLESRIEAHDKNPKTAIPWQEFDAQIMRRLKK